MPKQVRAGTASDADRQEAIAKLRARYLTGEMSLRDYEERVDRMIDATSFDTIDEALTGVAVVPQMPVGDFDPATRRRALSAILGERTLQGRWIVTPETAAVSIFGQVTLDLRDVAFQEEISEIYVLAVLGEIKVIVPPDLNVQVDVQGVLGTVTQEGLPSARDAAPQVLIRGRAILGAVKVVGRARVP